MAAPSLFALSLILGAAVMHALWNAMIKGAGDRVLAMGLINIGHAVPGAVMVLAFLPPADEAWPFIIASTVIHYFYYGFLLLAYRHGDLSQVYPIARGVAPVLVALGGQWFAGEYLPLQAWLGILLVSAAIGFLMFAQRRQPANRITVLAALATGVIIASYSIVDGLGVRASQNPFGYIGWLFLLESISGIVLLALRRRALHGTAGRVIAIGVAGGLISALAYALAIYAKSLTTLGTVSAIRESSVIIAALIGVVWFGERPWKIRVVSAALVAIGVILLATAGR